MKKFYMTMVAMLCGVAAMAQNPTGQFDNELYAEDVKLDKGETSFELPICMRNAEENVVTAVSFRIGLPEGITHTLNKKGKMVDAVVDEDRMEEHKPMWMATDAGDYMLNLYDAKSGTFYETEGPICYVPLTVAEDVAAVDGTYAIKIYAISLAAPGAVSLPTNEDGFEVTVTIGEGTGINSINANDSNAPIYNVAGQRVSKAQKGVFIQNGKKVAVK